MIKKFKPLLILKLRFIPSAVAITLLSVIIFATGQQVYRQSANDPQVQIVQNVKDILMQGNPPEALVNENKVDFSKNTSPYIIVYNNTGKVVASAGEVNGQVPALPSGVFDAVSKGGDKSFTWQPMKGVRSAVVVSKYTANGQTGFVLAGRSLMLVEERIMKLGLMVLVAWFVTLVVTFASFVVSDKLKKKFMS